MRVSGNTAIVALLELVVGDVQTHGAVTTREVMNRVAAAVGLELDPLDDLVSTGQMEPGQRVQIMDRHLYGQEKTDQEWSALERAANRRRIPEDSDAT